MYSLFSWSLTEDLVTCEPATEQQRCFKRACTCVTIEQCDGSSTSARPRRCCSRHCHRSPDSLFLGSFDTSFHAFKQTIVLSCFVKTSRVMVLPSDLHTFLCRTDKWGPLCVNYVYCSFKGFWLPQPLCVYFVCVCLWMVSWKIALCVTRVLQREYAVHVFDLDVFLRTDPLTITSQKTKFFLQKKKKFITVNFLA